MLDDEKKKLQKDKQLMNQKYSKMKEELEKNKTQTILMIPQNKQTKSKNQKSAKIKSSSNNNKIPSWV